MFKKLKDKIAEEVKQSPLKSVQQLAHAVVSPSSSSVFEPSSNNDHFCIDENDDDLQETPKNSPARLGGFTSVDLQGQISSPSPDRLPSRRSSISSITSEASSLFPIFESPSAASYHLQSDMESTSEMEDGLNTGWEHLSKERITAAFQKSRQRYLKYKGRYSNIVLHYRELEVERNKLKSVLSETQDKALRRIAELKEQCSLEQKAKAHLEDVLRNDLEEKDHTIDALNTKIHLLKSRFDDIAAENLIDLSEDNTSSKTSETTELKDRIKKLEGLLAKCKVAITEKNTRIANLDAQLGNTEGLAKQVNGELVETKGNDSDLEELLTNTETDLQKDNKKLISLHQKENELVQQQVIRSQNEVQNYQKKIQELEKELTIVNTKLEHEVTERCKAEYLIEQNNKKLEEEEQKFLQKSNEVDCYKNEKKILEKELEELKFKLENDVKAQESLEEFMTEEVHEKNKEIEEYQNEVKKLKTDLDQIKEKLDSETKIKNNLETAVEESKACLVKEKETVDVLNKEIGEFRVKNKQLEKERLELKNKFDDQVLSHSLLQDTNKSLEKENSMHLNQCAEKNKIIEEYQTKNKQLENEVLNLEEKISADVSTQSLNEEMSIQLKERDDNLLLKVKEIDETKNENQLLKKELFILTEKCNTESTGHISAQDMIKNLEVKVTEKENKIKDQNSLINNYEEHIKAIENDLFEMKTKLDHEALVRLKLEENEISKTKQQDFEKSKIENELAHMKEVIDNVLAEKASVERKLMETEGKVLELANDFQNNQVSLQQVELELIKARKEISEKTDNINKFTKQLSEMEIETQKKLSLLNEKDEELNNIKEIKSELDNNLLAANEQIVILKTKYESSQRELFAAFEGNEKSQEISTENLELKDKLSELQQQFDHYKSQLQKKFQSDIHNLKANFEKAIEEKSNEILQLRNGSEQLEEQLALKNNAVNELSTNLNQAEKDSNLLIKDLQEKFISKENEMVSNINSCREEIGHLSENLNKVLLGKTNLEDEISRLNSLLQQYSNTDTENGKLLIEVNKLQKENHKCVIEIQELTLQLKEKDLIQKKESAEKSEYEKSVNELLQLKNLHEKIVQKQQNLLEKSLIQKNNVDDLKEMLRLLGHFFNQMNLELKEELNRTSINCVRACTIVGNIKDKQTNDYINEIEKKYSTKIKTLESELDNSASDQKLLFEECERLRAYNSELNTKVSDLTQKVNELTTELIKDDEVQDEVNQLKEDNCNLTKELDELRDSHTQKLKNLIKDFEVQLEKKDEAFRELESSQFDRRQDEECYAANELKEQIYNLQQDLETRGDAFEKLVEEHKLLTQNRDTEISELKSKHVKELREHDKKWRACLDKRLAEEEIRHQEEIRELSKEWHTERKTDSQDFSVSAIRNTEHEVLETENQLALTAVESGATSLDMVKRQLTAVTFQLNEQQRQHRLEVAELQRLLTIDNHKKKFLGSNIEDCTEMEYLRNVLYEYMMGKEPLVLAKVLAAIVKFDSNQVRSVLSKEEQKISLMGQLGFG